MRKSYEWFVLVACVLILALALSFDARGQSAGIVAPPPFRLHILSAHDAGDGFKLMQILVCCDRTAYKGRCVVPAINWAYLKIVPRDARLLLSVKAVDHEVAITAAAIFLIERAANICRGLS